MIYDVLRRRREMRELAVRIGLRDDELAYESLRRRAIIVHQASMCMQTTAPDPWPKFGGRSPLRSWPPATRDHIGYQWTGAGEIMLTLTVRTEDSFRVIPEGHVFTEICMLEKT
ncbi:hypothetical protein OG439_03205 [Amycolatopsis sp. NBC_01307]|uniref:hypothetical protein n=1 Tax=Amycolatopsis sp. NBC_01307 TaxID=2903561 RepID=UPI002E10E594|nr:hypothetical protein OG439_03205 [Amycolatopsis sp. NBC_01307]